MEDIFEFHRRLLRSGIEIFDLHDHGITPANAMAAIRLRIRDRHHLDPEHLTDQRMQHCRWAALLAADNRTDALGLLFGRLAVKQHANPPVTLDHHRWRVHNERECEATNVDTVDRTPFDVIVEYDEAAVVRRR